MIHFVVNTSPSKLCAFALSRQILRVRLFAAAAHAGIFLLSGAGIRLTVCAFSPYLAASTKKHFLDSV